MWGSVLSVSNKNSKDFFSTIKDHDENLIWQDSPEFWPFIISGLPFLIGGLLWGLFDLFFLMAVQSGDGAGSSDRFPLGLFFLVHSMPCWLGIGNQIRLFLVYPNTAYAITNKRVLIRGGFWGTDFRSIDHDRIADMSVNVNPIDTFFGSGTININTGTTTSNGRISYDKIKSVKNPYDVFRQLKTVSVDVKTDWQYPNNLRPDANNGYKTKYNPGDKES